MAGGSLRQLTIGRPWLWNFLISLVMMPLGILQGQSPDAAVVNVPGWTPADQVSPLITVGARQDPRTRLWSYTYRVSNGTTAGQVLIKLAFIISVPVESAKAPNGWWAATYNPPAALPGVTFAAKQDTAGSWPAAAAPGGSMLTFTIVSRHPPGTIEYYARGNASPISIDGLDAASQARLPDERQDAMRGTTIGPAQ